MSNWRTTTDNTVSQATSALDEHHRKQLDTPEMRLQIMSRLRKPLQQGLFGLEAGA